MSRPMDVQAELNDGLRELRLPAVRQSYEELARQAEREQLTYEQYLLELVHREEDARQEARTTRLLRQSRIPREKNLETSRPRGRLKRYCRVTFWTGARICSCSVIPAAAKRMPSVRWGWR